MKNTTAAEKCLIVGHGEMGQAFEYLLGTDRVDIWQRSQPQPLDELARNRRFIFLCIPAEPVYQVATQIAGSITAQTICLGIAKGLDKAGRPAAMAMRDALGHGCIQGVIHGPMISEELRAGHPGFGDLAVSDTSVVPEIQQLFANTGLVLHPNGDLAGLTWCAILKNVYAMAFGMADELALGDNVRGYLAVVSLRELSRLSLSLGGQAETPFGLAGLGDLITTATSEDSHHHSLGRQLARGDRANLHGEGVHTLQTVVSVNLLNTSEFPLFRAIQQIVLGGERADEVLARFIRG